MLIMRRYLSEKEKQKLLNISKLEVDLLISYGNIVKFILPIIFILISFILYNSLKVGNIIIYVIVVLILSILVFILISKLQSPFMCILKDKYTCFESNVINNKIFTPARFVNRKNTYPINRNYVLVNINGNNMEVMYKGKQFNYLNFGDNMIIIEYIIFGKKEYICYSYDELNKEDDSK